MHNLDLGVAVMIRTILAVAALSMATPAYADTCGDVGKLAEAIMKARQAETPYSAVRQVAEQYRYKAPAIYRIAINMASDAYEQPAYFTEAFRQQEIAKFRNKWERFCYEIADKQERGGQVDDDFIGY